MTLHVHKLEGCAPTPLAHYLKALAILRLVSEQRDPDARGWWSEEAFFLATKLSRDELVCFFLDEYEPTPILSPWNAGSGFYLREGKTKEKDGASGQLKKTGVRDQPTAATRAIDALAASESPRMNRYRECLRVARAVVIGFGFTEAPGEEQKASLIAALRSRLPEAGTKWLDAAVTSVGDSFECAPLVGSGGNDGNEDFSKNFLERILDLLGPAGREGQALLHSCLFAETVPGALDIAAGQFLPAGNGGSNAGIGFSGRSTANPWDYVLAAEGSLVFAGAAARRLDSATGGAAFPFAVRIDPAGYASAADSDREASRFEVWLPLWGQPATLSNVCALLTEGRARIDRADAQRSTDVARSLASLGTSRGITAFERTAFFTRNGNMHYSAPVGRWDVASQPKNDDLLDDIQLWMRAFRGFARDKLAPKAITSAGRTIEEAILAVCRAGAEPARWQSLLIALGRAEAALLRSPNKTGDPKRRLSPLPSLRRGWIAAANDGSPELRLALALASQDVALRHHGKAIVANVRSHWMPLDRARAARHAYAQRLSARFATDSNGLANDPDVACLADDLERDCIALVRRRVHIAPTLATRGLGLFGARGAEAPLADVMAFLAEEVDDARILALARPLMALEWWDAERRRLDAAPPLRSIDAAYAIMRVAHLSEPLDRGKGDKVIIALDPAPIARLAAGDLGAAATVCLRRLRASGLSPKLQTVTGTARHARRLAASLAFPIRSADASRCADLVTKPYEVEESVHAR
jgi:CRISPR-associated protein Csx17